MGARREVCLVTHDRTDVAHVELPNCKVALPADNVDWVKWVKDGREFVIDLHANLPFPARLLEVWLRLRHRNHCRIIECVLAYQTFVRLLKLRLRLNDQKEIISCLGQNAVSDSAGHHQIVTFLETERAE